MHSFCHHSTYNQMIFTSTISSQDPDVRICPNASSFVVPLTICPNLVMLFYRVRDLAPDPLILLNKRFSAVGTTRFVVCPLSFFTFVIPIFFQFEGNANMTWISPCTSQPNRTSTSVRVNSSTRSNRGAFIWDHKLPIDILDGSANYISAHITLRPNFCVLSYMSVRRSSPLESSPPFFWCLSFIQLRHTLSSRNERLWWVRSLLRFSFHSPPGSFIPHSLLPSLLSPWLDNYCSHLP
jgi:hypothetical protein